MFPAAAVMALGAWMVTPATAEAQEMPYLKAEGTWISISGTVQSATPSSFVLDYGDSTITVETDIGDLKGAAVLQQGDRVTVNGRIDDDFLEKREIEASNVFVERLGTTYYADRPDMTTTPGDTTGTPSDTSTADNGRTSMADNGEAWTIVWLPIVEARTVLEGTVTKVGDDEFTLAAGSRTFEVEVDEMSNNPLDDDGYHRIHVGDRVRVWGELDRELFEGEVFDATSVVTLKNNSTSKKSDMHPKR
jgi:uncharacterized protein YdeI (BOF family)